MAPELLQLKSYGTPIDIWALGCLFYELLTGGDSIFSKHKDRDKSFKSQYKTVKYNVQKYENIFKKKSLSMSNSSFIYKMFPNIGTNKSKKCIKIKNIITGFY